MRAFCVAQERSISLKRIRTIEVPSHIGERVRIAGWLHSLRQMGGINFLVIRDGWGTVQAVAESERELASLRSSEAGLENGLALDGLDARMPHATRGVELHDPQVGAI